MCSYIKKGRPSIENILAQFASVTKALTQYGGLPNLEQASAIWDDIWYVEAHNSTGIEGNTLVLREVKAVLQRRRAIGGKELKDYLEVEGYGKAAKWVYAQARAPKTFIPEGLISITELRFIHELLLESLWKVEPHKNALASEKPGSFREHDILPFGGGMTPPTFPLVLSNITAWIDKVNHLGVEVKNEGIDAYDLPLRLARLHCEFERIHPFLDGNGRTGRLALNLILVRLGFPPAIILKSRREQYLKALDCADKGNDSPLGVIIAKAVIDNVHRFIIPQMAEGSNRVRLDSMVTKNISYAALRQAANRGRLEAEIGDDGFWYSTPQALNEYIKTKYQRNPPARKG
ncbi:MAG: Fic family protein [Synergistaceae bacterium]|jgi:Fic family protein|nr:Fic family protein [Synergistaceae bacterium]